MIYNSNEYIKHIAAKTAPSMRYNQGTDLSLWQKNAKEKLTELLGLPFEKCEDRFTVTSETQCDEYTRTDFEFQSEEGYFARCVFLFPKNAKGKLPCAICLQGHTTGMHVSFGEVRFDGDKEQIKHSDFAVRAIREGICAVTLEQRYMGTAGQNENGSPQCLRGRSMPALLFGRTPIGERVWDVQRLIDVLYAHFGDKIDTEKLMCLGNSGGGTATLYASCLDDRIKISVPSCAVSTFDASIVAMYHCPCNYVPSIRKYFDMGDICALTAPRRLLVVAGEKDNIFPIGPAKETYAITKSIYELLGIGDRCNMVIGSEGHRFYPDEAWPIIHSYLNELK